MNDLHLIWILKQAANGHQFKSIVFHESGDMDVKFWDTGGNFHDLTFHDNGHMQTNA